jgi:hypothetical protein
MKKLSIITCALMIIFLWVAPGFSQDQDETVMPKSGKGACRVDVEKLCKNIKPGGGRLLACIKSNNERLSKECKDHIAKVMENKPLPNLTFKSAVYHTNTQMLTVVVVNQGLGASIPCKAHHKQGRYMEGPSERDIAIPALAPGATFTYTYPDRVWTMSLNLCGNASWEFEGKPDGLVTLIP